MIIKGLGMSIKKGSPYKLNHSKSLLELLQRITDKEGVNQSNHDIRGENNSIECEGTSLESTRFEIWGNNNQIIIGRNCQFKDVTFHIEGDNHLIQIGAEVAFNIAGSIWFEDHDCTLTIGDQSTFENVHLAVTEPHSTLTIGQNCMFSYDIDVRTGDSHSVIVDEDNKRSNYAQNISFGDHVWVASHCVILKGSMIGDNSIVGTRSVVTKPFLQNGIVVAGNPAKIIKKGIHWKRERVYDENVK